MNELINKDNEWIIHFMSSLDSLLARFEHLTANYRPTLGGERFFTDKEVSARLTIATKDVSPISSWAAKSSTVNPTSKGC